jgi:diguanylate cyclase (GGDEF)-like protein
VNDNKQPLILIIEDNPSDLRVLGNLVNHLGEVIFATSGESGLILAQHRKPDLILLDVELPDINGFKICSELKKLHETEDAAVIFVTASNDEHSEVAALEAGAVDYICKPYVAQIVRARVKTHLTLKKQASELQELANKDGLTGVFSRRYFDYQARVEINRHARQCSPLSLVLIDVDHFKSYNDHYGHLKGDWCLKTIAQTLQSNSRRPGEFVARYGGEEFVAILPNTNYREAEKYGRWICERVRSLALPHENSPMGRYISISAGLITITPDPTTMLDTLITEADKALYQAKHNGRDQFVQGNISIASLAVNIFKNPQTSRI